MSEQVKRYKYEEGGAVGAVRDFAYITQRAGSW